MESILRKRPSLLHACLAGSATLLAACGSGGGAGTVNVQISGEDLAIDGFGFPEGSEVVLSDGWQIHFSHVLVTVGRVTLSENPDKAPSDQSQTGDLVADVIGPWAVDLHVEGKEPGAGGEGSATLLTTIDELDHRGGAAPVAGERYAFGYELAPAADGAELVNFAGDAEAKALYGGMISRGYVVLYAGTATFAGTACETSDDAYDFTRIPQTVKFELGFATPTSYLNCQNQDNQGQPFEGEEYQRGITIKENQASVAQITLHLDHPFYSSAQHEPLLYFDQLAARLVGKANAVLTLDDVEGMDPLGMEDGEGAALPWRACDGSTVPTAMQRSFDPGSVPVDPAADPADALRDYRDFVHYVQSTQGHLNGGEGLCYASRNYPSPP